MTTTTFTDFSTVIDSDWLNDVDAIVYDIFAAATTKAAARVSLFPTPTDGNILVGDGTDWVNESGATARTSLGLAIGTNVQAWDADLDAIAALAKTDSNVIVGNGTTWVAESGATVRTSLGLGTGDSPQFAEIEIGHATDTTVTRASAGDIALEGNILYRAGGTDVPLTDGGTGASSKGAAQIALGIIPDDGAWAGYTPTISSGTGTITTASGTGRWLKQGKIVHFSVILTITTNGTGATSITFTLPQAGPVTNEYAFAGQEIATSGVGLTVKFRGGDSTTVVSVYKYDSTYPATNGSILIVSGSYEVA